MDGNNGRTRKILLTLGGIAAAVFFGYIAALVFKSKPKP